MVTTPNNSGADKSRFWPNRALWGASLNFSRYHYILRNADKYWKETQAVGHLYDLLWAVIGQNGHF